MYRPKSLLLGPVTILMIGLITLMAMTIGFQVGFEAGTPSEAHVDLPEPTVNDYENIEPWYHDYLPQQLQSDGTPNKHVRAATMALLEWSFAYAEVVGTATATWAYNNQGWVSATWLNWIMQGATWMLTLGCFGVAGLRLKSLHSAV